MKPSNEEKARFFACYWGQPVFRHPTKRNGGHIILYGYGLQKGWLELKPLSSISNEDAINVTKIIYPIENENKSEFQSEINKRRTESHTVKEGRFEIEEMEQTGSFDLRIADYLRSKGYALPWMGISVDDQVKYGWIKLKQQ